MTAIETNQLVEISRLIRYADEQARQGALSALEHKVTVAKELTKARKICGRGPAFFRWALAEHGYAKTHIYRHFVLLRIYNRRGRELAVANVWKLLAPGNQPEENKGNVPSDGTKGLILTGHVDGSLWDGEGEAPVPALVAACQDWKVRRG